MSVFEKMTTSKEAYEDLATEIMESSDYMIGLHDGVLAARGDLTIEAASCETL